MKLLHFFQLVIFYTLNNRMVEYILQIIISNAQWRSNIVVKKTLDMFSGVDPRFPRGRQPIIWPIFPKNCFKLKKNRPGGGGL